MLPVEQHNAGCLAVWLPGSPSGKLLRWLVTVAGQVRPFAVWAVAWAVAGLGCGLNVDAYANRVPV